MGLRRTCADAVDARLRALVRRPWRRTSAPRRHHRGDRAAAARARGRIDAEGDGRGLRVSQLAELTFAQLDREARCGRLVRGGLLARGRRPCARRGGLGAGAAHR